MSETPLLELRGISKSFGSVQALSDVDFDVRNGEVMALVGDNGAGKSTLIKCVAGIHAYDDGEILFDGHPVTIHGPKDAAKLGVEVVYQGLGAVRQPRRRPEHVPRSGRARSLLPPQGSSHGAAHGGDVEVALGHDDSLDPSTRRLLSGGQRQSVAVAKAVQWNSRLVILDEPTAALGVAQTRQVLDLVKRLADRGLAVVLISHNLHDIFEVATRITVIRLGRDVGVYERDKTTQEQVVQAITAGIPTKVAGIAETGADVAP